MTDFEKRKIGGDEDVRIERQKTPGKETTIYIEIDHEVTEAYDRIKKLRNKEVFLVIPKKAILLQSVINLKILKRKCEELGKTIAIITHDTLGKKLAEQIGIPVFEKMPMKEGAVAAGQARSKHIPENFAKAPLVSEPSVRPFKLSEKKISIGQLLKRGTETGSTLIEKFSEWLRKRRKKQQYKTEITIITPNKPALITLIILSIFLLLSIAYIALPGATITLIPASNRIEQPINLVLSDFERYRSDLDAHTPQMVASYKITPPPLEQTFTYPATGKNVEGTHAHGEVAIFNESGIPWPLVATTRFQTESGLVFRIRQAITVPRGTQGKPGILQTEIFADPLDAKGQPTGDRGNIGPSTFFLPGLQNPENRKKIYAKNTVLFTGGFTRVTKMVSDEDIKAAQERAKREIIASAQETLKRSVQQINTERGTELVLLTDPRTITITDPQITIPSHLKGSALENFQVTARMDISGIAFNQRELLNLLKQELLARKTPDKKVITIAENSLTYRFVDIDVDAGKVKLTATLRGIEQYDLDPDQENSAQLLKKIKDHIAGKNIDEATFYMQNLPEIDRVEIKSWPFWAPTLPTVPDNIEFLLRSEEPEGTGTGE